MMKNKSSEKNYLKHWYFFLSGIFISTLGSTTFTVCLISFLLERNYDLKTIGILIGCARLFPVITTGLFGHVPDRLQPKKVILLIDYLAIGITIGLYQSALHIEENFILFSTLFVLRSGLLNIQSGARSKISKLMSSQSFESNSKNAIHLNFALQGSNLIAGLMSYFFLNNHPFTTIILFDLSTFLIHSFFLLILPGSFAKNESVIPLNKIKIGISTKFKHLFHYVPKQAVQDIILSLAITGFWSFGAKLTQESHYSTPIWLINYGIAVLFTSIFHSVTLKIHYLFAWISLLSLFFMYYIIDIYSPQVIILHLCMCFFYWVLNHKISADIQFLAPVEHISSIMSARNVLLILCLGSGEFIVGLSDQKMGVGMEGIFRGSIILLFLMMTFTLKLKKIKGH